MTVVTPGAESAACAQCDYAVRGTPAATCETDNVLLGLWKGMCGASTALLFSVSLLAHAQMHRTDCAKGEYLTAADTPGPLCSACPAHSTTPEPGATSVTECVCEEGYSGRIASATDTCQKNDCCDPPKCEYECFHGGRCIPGVAFPKPQRGWCDCEDTGFGGETCRIQEFTCCDERACVKRCFHGECRAPDERAPGLWCDCRSGFSGETCQTPSGGISDGWLITCVVVTACGSEASGTTDAVIDERACHACKHVTY